MLVLIRFSIFEFFVGFFSTFFFVTGFSSGQSHKEMSMIIEFDNLTVTISPSSGGVIKNPENFS